MADIFLSYAHEDEGRIRDLAHALEEHGWSIFWDRRIPAGKTWQSYIGQALADAKCVIVAWSQHSITSDWVIEEANNAKERGYLVPVFLDPVKPPFGFGGIQAANLTDWKPGSPSPRFEQLIQDITGVVGGEPPPPEPPPPKPEAQKAHVQESETIKPESSQAGKKRNILLIGSMLALALVIVGGLVTWSSRPRPQPRPAEVETPVAKPYPVAAAPTQPRSPGTGAVETPVRQPAEPDLGTMSTTSGSYGSTFRTETKVLDNLPVRVDLRNRLSPIHDQTAVNLGTASAIACAVDFARARQHLEAVSPSLLFIYYNQRAVAGAVETNNDGTVEDGIKAVTRYGVPPGRTWPLDVSRIKEKPPKSVYDEALKHRVLKAQRVIRNLAEMKGCLASDYPFIFYCTLFQSFESSTVAKTGKVEMPGVNEHVLGKRGVLVVGYDDEYQRFIVRNSWGTAWGIRGYFTLPYEYLLDPRLANDFWAITLVE